MHSVHGGAKLLHYFFHFLDFISDILVSNEVRKMGHVTRRLLHGLRYMGLGEFLLNNLRYARPFKLVT